MNKDTIEQETYQTLAPDERKQLLKEVFSLIIKLDENQLLSVLREVKEDSNFEENEQTSR